MMECDDHYVSIPSNPSNTCKYIMIPKTKHDAMVKELKGILTNGWTTSDRKKWKEYLEIEVKPHFPGLYCILKGTRLK